MTSGVKGVKKDLILALSTEPDSMGTACASSSEGTYAGGLGRGLGASSTPRLLSPSSWLRSIKTLRSGIKKIEK